jgi:WD40 repeat protein
MRSFLRLKILNKHKAAIWNICWSSYGEFLLSCGADGIILIWGPISKFLYKDSNLKKISEKIYFLKWNNLCKFESFLEFKTYRKLAWLCNFNQFSVCSFSGISHLCKIIFLNSDKSLSLNKQSTLIGPSSEIKSCNYSPDGNLISISSRNKTVWIWKKEFKKIFNCYFILKQHDSDVKCLKWYPKHKYLITGTYDGIINIFKKKKKKLSPSGTISLFRSTIWNVTFNEKGNEFYFCTNKGEIGCFLKIKKIFMCIFLSTFCISFFLISNYTLAILHTNNEENVSILRRCKFSMREKDLQFLYGGISKLFRFKIENSLICPHLGDINSLAWHPNNTNIIASCGDDMTICIWYYS